MRTLSDVKRNGRRPRPSRKRTLRHAGAGLIMALATSPLLAAPVLDRKSVV